MSETKGLHRFERPLRRQADRERRGRQLNGVAQPTLVVHELLHPRSHVSGGDVHEHERSSTGVKPLRFKEVGLGSWAVEDGDDGLAVVDHVTVKFHHFAFLSRAEQEQGHSGRMRVPDFSVACGRFVHELTDGHVRNHGGYSHLGTRNEEAVPTFYPTGEAPWEKSIPWRERVLQGGPRRLLPLEACCG